MQITFQTHFPKDIKGSLVYERTQTQIKTDSIDDLLVKVAENISNQISNEPAVISQYSNVTFSDFSFSNYHSNKTINLHLENMDDSSARPIVFQIIVYFDTADALLIDQRVMDQQIFTLSQRAFNKLNTLIVQ